MSRATLKRRDEDDVASIHPCKRRRDSGQCGWIVNKFLEGTPVSVRPCLLNSSSKYENDTNRIKRVVVPPLGRGAPADLEHHESVAWRKAQRSEGGRPGCGKMGSGNWLLHQAAIDEHAREGEKAAGWIVDYFIPNNRA
jgi:hypothetical protein